MSTEYQPRHSDRLAPPLYSEALAHSITAITAMLDQVRINFRNRVPVGRHRQDERPGR